MALPPLASVVVVSAIALPDMIIIPVMAQIATETTLPPTLIKRNVKSMRLIMFPFYKESDLSPMLPTGCGQAVSPKNCASHPHD